MHSIPSWFANPEQDYCASSADDSLEPDPVVAGATRCEQQMVYPLQMGEQESPLFDCLAREVVDIAGTAIEYYVLDLQRSTRDPLYDEPVEEVWNGPYALTAQITISGRRATAREEGMVWEFDAEGWIARSSVEALGMSRPKEGDVLRFWNVPFFDQFGSGNSVIRDAGYYFDVTQVETDGHVFDGPTFTGFKLTLKRNSSFAAERRVYGDGGARVV